MKIEEILKLLQWIIQKKLSKYFIHKNVITENFNEILKTFEISGEQYNVLQILKRSKGNPANIK
jgi:hypothetical protein